MLRRTLLYPVVPRTFGWRCVADGIFGDVQTPILLFESRLPNLPQKINTPSTVPYGKSTQTRAKEQKCDNLFY